MYLNELLNYDDCRIWATASETPGRGLLPGRDCLGKAADIRPTSFATRGRLPYRAASHSARTWPTVPLSRVCAMSSSPHQLFADCLVPLCPVHRHKRCARRTPSDHYPTRRRSLHGPREHGNEGYRLPLSFCSLSRRWLVQDGDVALEARRSLHRQGSRAGREVSRYASRSTPSATAADKHNVPIGRVRP